MVKKNYVAPSSELILFAPAEEITASGQTWFWEIYKIPENSSIQGTKETFDWVNITESYRFDE